LGAVKNKAFIMHSISLILQHYDPQSELYALLTKHSRSVADKALEIAQRCAPRFALDTVFIEEAAMLHDIGIFLTKAPSIHCFGKHPYICHGYLGANILRAAGYPRHALVCERHTGTGLSLQEIQTKNLPIPHRDMRPQTMEEQIICFADLFFSKTHPDEEKSVEQVRTKIQRTHSGSLSQFEEWCEMFL
jgi:uncharacterized protein